MTFWKTKRRPSTFLSNISKGTGLRLIHAKFEKDPARNGKVTQVWRGSIRRKKIIFFGYAVVD